MALFNECRRRALDELRRRQVRERSRLTPAERVRRADELRRLARAVHGSDVRLRRSGSTASELAAWLQRHREQR